MYSKAGRATTEMFFALQHGPEMIENGGRSSKSPDASRMNQKVDIY